MIRRQLFNLLRQEMRLSSTSTGLRGQHPMTKDKPVLHQCPKLDPMTLVGNQLEEMVAEIHQELNGQVKNDSELGKVSR